METTYNGYASEGYTIAGLQTIQNKSGELRDGWIAKKREKKPKKQYHIYTDEEIQEVRRLHAEGHFHKSICEITGLGYSQVKRILASGIGRKRFRDLSEAEQEEIKAIYPYTMTKDIADRYSITYDSIQKHATSNGWQRCDDFQKICNERKSHTTANYYRTITAEQKQAITDKKVATKAKIMESERRRVRFDLEQQTRWKVGQMPKVQRNLRQNMRFKRGYIVPFRQTDLLLYDENTRRSAKMEEKARSYGMEIKEIVKHS